MPDGVTRTVVGRRWCWRAVDGADAPGEIALAHAGFPIVGDGLYGVDYASVAASIGAFRLSGGGITREEREAAARRRLLFASSSPSSSSAVSPKDDASPDDASAGDASPGDVPSPCARLALHAWNVDVLHPRALVPLRLCVDMPGT